MALRKWNAQVGMIAGIMWSGPVLAQDLPQQTTLAQADIGSADILVQARRRTESIEDVPASVSVLGEVEMERLSIRDVADYTRQTPGAILIGSGPEYLNDIALRGQGGGRLRLLLDQPGVAHPQGGRQAPADVGVGEFRLTPFNIRNRRLINTCSLG